MQLAASLQQSHLIKGGRRQATGPEPAAGLVLTYGTGLLVYGRRIFSVINGAGSQQDSFLQPHLYLYLQSFPFIYPFMSSVSWVPCCVMGTEQWSVPSLPKPLWAPSNDFCLSFRPLIIWLPLTFLLLLVTHRAPSPRWEYTNRLLPTLRLQSPPVVGPLPKAVPREPPLLPAS